MTAILIQDVLTERMKVLENKLKKATDTTDVIRCAARLEELYWVYSQLDK